MIVRISHGSELEIVIHRLMDVRRMSGPLFVFRCSPILCLKAFDEPERHRGAARLRWGKINELVLVGNYHMLFRAILLIHSIKSHELFPTRLTASHDAFHLADFSVVLFVG